MRTIGLTGGIGSGKTTVSNRFAKLGIPIVDADTISHQLTRPNGSGSLLIRQKFGNRFFSTQGELNRRKLRDEVFNAPEKLKQLEHILHPLIRAEIMRQTAALERQGAPYCIVSIPLILESGMLDLVEQLIVVDVPECLQIQRVRQRDQVSDIQIKQIISQQATRDARLNAADFIIDNSQTIEETIKQVKNIDKILRQPQ